MAQKKNLLLFWSGGKDSAVSLFELKCPEYEIVGLVSVFTGDRLQMHDLESQLIEEQARALDLPLVKAHLPESPSNDVWKSGVREAIEKFTEQTAVEALAFGDLHLQDLKVWREEFCSEMGMKAVFPLWEWRPALVLQAFQGLGHQAIVHCIDPKKLDKEMLGRAYNQSFVSELKPGVDPCGEFGEFQTFVFSGPFFEFPISFKTAGTYEKSGYIYQELLLSQAPSSGHNRMN